MKDLLEVMMSGRSIRHYTGSPLSDEEIYALVEAAQSAPSSFNRQQVRFLVTRNDQFKAAIVNNVEQAHSDVCRVTGQKELRYQREADQSLPSECSRRRRELDPGCSDTRSEQLLTGPLFSGQRVPGDPSESAASLGIDGVCHPGPAG